MVSKDRRYWNSSAERMETPPISESWGCAGRVNRQIWCRFAFTLPPEAVTGGISVTACDVNSLRIVLAGIKVLTTGISMVVPVVTTDWPVLISRQMPICPLADGSIAISKMALGLFGDLYGYRAGNKESILNKNKE